MTKASRVPVIGVLLIGVLCPPAPVSAQQRPAIADQIAKTYGLDSFSQIDAIRYTFNIDLAALSIPASFRTSTSSSPDRSLCPARARGSEKAAAIPIWSTRFAVRWGASTTPPESRRPSTLSRSFAAHCPRPGTTSAWTSSSPPKGSCVRVAPGRSPVGSSPPISPTTSARTYPRCARWGSSHVTPEIADVLEASAEACPAAERDLC